MRGGKGYTSGDNSLKGGARLGQELKGVEENMNDCSILYANGNQVWVTQERGRIIGMSP